MSRTPFEVIYILTQLLLVTKGCGGIDRAAALKVSDMNKAEC